MEQVFGRKFRSQVSNVIKNGADRRGTLNEAILFQCLHCILHKMRTALNIMIADNDAGTRAHMRKIFVIKEAFVGEISITPFAFP